MHYFLIEATPESDNEQAQDTGGAFISCWVNFPMADGAELLAVYYIQEAGWIPGEVQERQWVEKTDYEADPEHLPYFLEAEQDGASFVFHCWPAGPAPTDDTQAAV